ncbi:MAG: hypothetical protein LC660_10090 [Desulfobacteraceae bacterium]|nr:hypothetical protein [Desulfobacteraceae bacterium]
MTLYSDIKKSMTRLSRFDNGEISAEFIFSKDLPLFSGHFPGRPILPGIAQIEMVKMAIETIRERPMTLQAIQKTKFSHQIKPENLIRVRIILSSGKKQGKSADEKLVQVRATLETCGITAGKVILSMVEATRQT